MPGLAQDFLRAGQFVFDEPQLSIVVEIVQPGLGLILEQAFVEIVADDDEGGRGRAKHRPRIVGGSEVLRQGGSRKPHAIDSAASGHGGVQNLGGALACVDFVSFDEAVPDHHE